MNLNRRFWCGKAPTCFPLINAIFDNLNIDQISFAGGDEAKFYFFFIILQYEYDVLMLWCFIYCMPPFRLYRVDERNVQLLLDAWLGAVQIRMKTYLVSATLIRM